MPSRRPGFRKQLKHLHPRWRSGQRTAGLTWSAVVAALHLITSARWQNWCVNFRLASWKRHSARHDSATFRARTAEYYAGIRLRCDRRADEHHRVTEILEADSGRRF